MNFQLLKNKILDDSISTDDRIELIKELVNSNELEIREFIESLLKSKNIRIRYFVRKIIREDVGLEENIEKVSWKDNTEEKVKKIIEKPDVKKNEPEVVKEVTDTSSEIVQGMQSTFNFKKAFLIAIITLISIVIISGLYIIHVLNKSTGSTSTSQEQGEKYDTFVVNPGSNQGKNSVDMMRESIKAYYENGKYFDAYLSQVTLFNFLKGKVNKGDYKRLIMCLEKLSWEFLSENKKNGENYLNNELRNTFEFIYQIYSAIHETKVSEKKLAKKLSGKPEILFFLSNKTMKKLNTKSDEFKDVSKKHTLKAIYQIYSKKFKQASLSIKKIPDNELSGLLNKILKSYAQPNLSSDKKKKFSIPKEFLNSMQALKNMNIEEACIFYIKALTIDFRIVKLEEKGLLNQVASDFSKLHFFDISDNSKILLISGFSNMVLGNIDKASKKLKKVEFAEYKELAVKLLKLFGKKKLMKILLKIATKKIVINTTETKVTSDVSSDDDDLKKKLESKKNDLINSGKFDEAVDVLKSLAKITPSESKPYIELAEVYIKNGQTADAIDAFEEGLKREPDLSVVRVKLAEMCFKSGEIKKAKVHYGLTLFYETDPEIIDSCQRKILELEKIKKK